MRAHGDQRGGTLHWLAMARSAPTRMGPLPGTQITTRYPPPPAPPRPGPTCTPCRRLQLHRPGHGSQPWLLLRGHQPLPGGAPWVRCPRQHVRAAGGCSRQPGGRRRRLLPHLRPCHRGRLQRPVPLPVRRRLPHRRAVRGQQVPRRPGLLPGAGRCGLHLAGERGRGAAKGRAVGTDRVAGAASCQPQPCTVPPGGCHPQVQNNQTCASAVAALKLGATAQPGDKTTVAVALDARPTWTTVQG